MQQPGPARPRISRETRLLLATILISVAALWALARLRFPERTVTPNPVPPLLTQLAEPPRFDDLASEISKLDSRLLPSLAVVEGPGSRLVAALRVRDDVGAAVVGTSAAPGAAREDTARVLAQDPASGFALVTIPAAPAPLLTPWTPLRLDRAQYLIASDVSRHGAALRPVFIGRLHATPSAAWQGDIWALPPRSAVAPGDVLFTVDGALAGVVIGHDGALALVPGDKVLGMVDLLLDGRATAARGWLGVDVQALTPSVASAAGAAAGVVVVWVDPAGPARDKLAAMDVIEAAGGEPVSSPEDWRVRLARLTAGESIVLRVRSGGASVDVPVVAAAQPVSNRPLALGLTLRTVNRGAEVVRVAAGSAAARAAIREGDVITAIGGIQTPTAPEVTRAYATAPAGRSLLVALTRGDAHHVLALEKLEPMDPK